MSIGSVLRAPAPLTTSSLRTKDHRPSPRCAVATHAQAGVLQARPAATEVPASVQAPSRLPEAWTAEELDDGSLERELSVLRAYSRHLRTSQDMQEDAEPAEAANAALRRSSGAAASNNLAHRQADRRRTRRGSRQGALPHRAKLAESASSQSQQYQPVKEPRYLTREEEAQACLAVQARRLCCSRLETLLANLVHKSPTLQELSRLEAAKEGSQEGEWWRELGYASGTAVAAAYKAGVEGSDRLLRANAIWIHSLTRPYQRQGLDSEYLINAAKQFYLAAAKDFDPARGTRLSTLAFPYVRQRMANLVNEEATVLREPYLRKKLRLNLHTLQRSLAEHSGRENVPPGEVASKAGVTKERAAELLADDGPNIVSWEGAMPSLGSQKGDGGDQTNEDTVEDIGASESARRTWNRRELSDLADDLQFCIDSCTSPLERRILALRYGLEDGRSRSLSEVGRMLNPSLTGERVRQMILAVTKRMRRTSMGSPDLKPYLDEYGVRMPVAMSQRAKRGDGAAMASFLD